jgi:hypothetical protein
MLALSALSVLAALGGPLRAASLVHGTYPYAVSSVPLLAELTKLAVCGVYLLLTKRDRTLNSQHLHLYILPSLLYLCVNNLNFVSLENLNVHTAQMLSNLRIPFTAVLMKWLLKSQFSALQIRSVIMLTLALGLHQVPYVIHAPDAGARHQIIVSLVPAWSRRRRNLIYFFLRETGSRGKLFGGIGICFRKCSFRMGIKETRNGVGLAGRATPFLGRNDERRLPCFSYQARISQACRPHRRSVCCWDLLASERTVAFASMHDADFFCRLFSHCLDKCSASGNRRPGYFLGFKKKRLYIKSVCCRCITYARLDVRRPRVQIRHRWTSNCIDVLCYL